MTKNQRLYNELRKFVEKDKVQEYDNEFFGQKRLTYKFLIPYFNRYMNLELVKDKLQLLIDDLIASLNVNELDANQRIKMLQIALQYTLPRMKQATNEVSVDLPLFVS